MNAHIYIREPIWNGSPDNREIGVAQYKMTTDNLEITIEYRNKQGERIYPYRYSISKEKALTYPTMTTKGTLLRIIPIKDLGVLGEEERMYLL